MTGQLPRARCSSCRTTPSSIVSAARPGSAINLRAEPLDGAGGDPAKLFSSHVHGDPATPVVEANLGDPIVVRSLVGATNDVHTLHVDGHWFRAEPYSSTSPPISTVHVGISERFDLVLPAAGARRAAGRLPVLQRAIVQATRRQLGHRAGRRGAVSPRFPVTRTPCPPPRGRSVPAVRP